MILVNMSLSSGVRVSFDVTGQCLLHILTRRGLPDHVNSRVASLVHSFLFIIS